jgi:hypothetical protein
MRGTKFFLSLFSIQDPMLRIYLLWPSRQALALAAARQAYIPFRLKQPHPEFPWRFSLTDSVQQDFMPMSKA